MSDANVFQGDCREVLACLEPASVDAVVTDPPYELGFMGKAWDGTGVANAPATWVAVLRVLKPGGHLLAFGGTRTYHRMVCAIEDAGFEIRDSIHWIYGTGFPKSLNLGAGRGTALKPAHEPIVLARKPPVGTTTANVLAFGTGGLNIDGCRIGTEARFNPSASSNEIYGQFKGVEQTGRACVGRWPANVVFDEEAAHELDQMTGTLTSGTGAVKRSTGKGYRANAFSKESRPVGTPNIEYGDSGGASRFFYCSKPSRRERDMGCDTLPLATAGEATGGRADGSAGLNSPRAGAGRTSGARNVHPTVKPLALMQWLVRLVTPVGGTVLDPFMGSGTTGMAAKAEDRDFIGIEQEASYLAIAEARMGVR